MTTENNTQDGFSDGDVFPENKDFLESEKSRLREMRKRQYDAQLEDFKRLAHRPCRSTRPSCYDEE